jgi:hypothetical protein
MPPPNEKPDLSVLKCVLARLISVPQYPRPILALQVTDGPYHGVTFWFSKFTLNPAQTDAYGMTPVRFETQIYEAPDGFRPDEAFDKFCGEIFYAWLYYVQMSDLQSLYNADIGSDKIQ